MNIKSLFPLEAEITQEILDTAKLYSIVNCVGAKTLRTAIKNKTNMQFEGHYLTWGNYNGSIIYENKLWRIGTSEDLNMMHITEPQTVTFILI